MGLPAFGEKFGDEQGLQLGQHFGGRGGQIVAFLWIGGELVELNDGPGPRGSGARWLDRLDDVSGPLACLAGLDPSEPSGAAVSTNTVEQTLLPFRHRSGATIAEIQLGAMALALAERLEDLASPAGPIFIHGNHIGIEHRQPGPAAGSPSQPSSTSDPATLRHPARDNGPHPPRCSGRR